MSIKIAITGKGGAGKTTLAALLVASLIRSGKRPVLAVDADPNSCLDTALGVQALNTIGRLRENIREGAARQPAASKRDILELKIAESLVEAVDFDFIAMGRPEGPGCYCYANNVLRDVLNAISQSYPYVIIDNEAGLENLSRRLVSRVDMLLMVGDTSHGGLKTIKRVYALSKEMGIEYKKLGVIINRVSVEHESKHYEALRAGLMAELAADFILLLPADEEVHKLNEQGKSLLELPQRNPINRMLTGLLERLA